MATSVLRKYKALVLEKKCPQPPYGSRGLSDAYSVSMGKLKCKAYAMLSQAGEESKILLSKDKGLCGSMMRQTAFKCHALCTCSCTPKLVHSTSLGTSLLLVSSSFLLPSNFKDQHFS